MTSSLISLALAWMPPVSCESSYREYGNDIDVILIRKYNPVHVSQSVSVPIYTSLSVLLQTSGQTDAKKVVIMVVQFICDIAWRLSKDMK